MIFLRPAHATILLALLALAGCAIPTDTVEVALRDVEVTRTFDAEYVVMAAARIEDNGTPCGGVTFGSANGLGDEWDLPEWAETIHLTLETDAIADRFSFRLCVIHASGGENLTRGPAPLELDARVVGNETVLLIALPDEKMPAPHGPQNPTITATVRGRA